MEFKMKKYRVEAFIIPTNHNNTNQIDDVKLANKLKDQSFTNTEEPEEEKVSTDSEKNFDDFENICDNKESNEINSSSDLSEVFFDIHEHIYDEIKVPENKGKKEVKTEKPEAEYTKAFFQIEEPIYDEPFIGNLTSIQNLKNQESNYDVPQSKWTLGTSKYRRFGIVAPKLPKRTTSLKSILEDIENFDETLQEICCHGRKNGCLLKSERPEDISEDIFKENWMQRLDALRKLETLLKDKEVALQSRERLLFKKEKELRILERLVKDKMKQAQLYAKRYKKSCSSESITNSDRNVESRSSNDSKGLTKSENTHHSSNFIFKSSSKSSIESKEEKDLKDPPNSRHSSTVDRFSNRVSSIRSKSRPRQKIRYDDLDSTLSADIGDSSFAITSKKFDPTVFKKPAAFMRSASERRPRMDPQVTALRLSSVIENDEQADGLVEEKTLRKISENILATQDQETKFLNYGLIDNESSQKIKSLDRDLSNQKRFSYLNLESMDKNLKPKALSKERPISWNEDADDWLKKKRQAYNLATKKKASESIAEKENLSSQLSMNKTSKVTKKKESNKKKFSIFR